MPIPTNIATAMQAIWDEFQSSQLPLDERLIHRRVIVAGTPYKIRLSAVRGKGGKRLLLEIIER